MRLLHWFLCCSLALLLHTTTWAQVGTPLPLSDGGAVDGWSGISVMYAEVFPVNEKVDTVHYYAADNRALDVEDGLYSFVPLIIRQTGGADPRGVGDGEFSIAQIGPVHVPTEAGENSFKWASDAIPNDGNLYHPGFVAWQDGVNDANGGLVSFAGSGGTGMKQFNVDTTDWTPDDLGEVEPGLVLNGLQTHTSGFGGRQYQLNFEMTNCPVDSVNHICEPYEPPPPPPPTPGLIGTENLRNGGSVDGWSGVTTMYGEEIPAGEKVQTVNYYAADNRAADIEDELYSVVPLIVRQEDGDVGTTDGTFSVFEVGPVHTPSEAGLNSFDWGSTEIPDDGNVYHPAILSWQHDVNDQNGGAVSFASNGGTGVIQFNVDSTFFPDTLEEEVGEDVILSDLQTHTSGPGGRQYQFNFVTDAFGGNFERCDLNHDGSCDAADIDDLTALIRAGTFDAQFDLNEDGELNQADRDAWVTDPDSMNTYFGDSNLDGEFNSSDFVAVFTAGLYEKQEPAGWAEGDWSGDGLFSSADFVRAFQGQGYEKGPRPAPQVPEPSTFVLAAIGLLATGLVRRKG